MAAKMEKTRTPGIYKRGSRYVFAYRVDGKQRWESCRTLDEARRAKAARATDIGRGEFEERSRITLHEYAREWVERYQGTGRRGFREETRSEYRALLDKYALSHFSAQTRVTEITPRHVASFVGWLCEQTKPAATKDEPDRRLPLSDKTVRNALGPLKACLATARREGLIRHNPATDVALPHRARVDDDDRPRPFPRVESDDGEVVETMELVVEQIDQSHRLMFELLAATGLRRSELLVLEGRHLALDGERPHVKIRQRVRRRRGEGLVIGPLKSRYSKRDVPIRCTLAERLAADGAGEGELVFRSAAGSVLDPDNLATRVLAPACKAAGVEWAGFHTFRHTVASRLFAEGRNVVKVHQRWLGHHSASFTLDTYVHLLDNDLGEPLQTSAPLASEGAVSLASKASKS
ncbi:MAG TPA: tyrosine-type recombinase/integrase [Solirubrobacteraceae bacterium]|jgi:integrase